MDFIKTYATLPASKATDEEHSFSKLKPIKTRLRNLCDEERLSDLLLLAIDREMLIDNNEALRIFTGMVLLLRFWRLLLWRLELQ